MACTGIDLEVDDLDVEDYVGGVVDCEVGGAEFLELVAFGGGIVEGEQRFFAVVVEVALPGVVRAGDS